MLWFFQNKQKRLKEEQLRIKIAEGQAALEDAAYRTADAADYITKALKEHLEDSIRQFESTARLISDALIICDVHGKVRAFNPVAESIFLTTSKDIEKTSVVKLFTLNGIIPSPDELWHAIDENLDGEGGTLQGHRCNNESFPLDISMARLDRGDSAQFILILIRDLTGFIAHRQLLNLQTQRFQTLFDMSFDGILIIQDSKIVAANQSAAKIFGVELEHIKDMPSDSLLRVNGREATSNDGKVQMLYSSTEINWNGKMAHLVTIKDVSSMHQLNKILQQSTTDGKDMICVFNSEMKIKFANFYFNSYYNLKRAVGRDIRDLLPDSDRVTFSIKILEISVDNPTVRSQVQHTLKDGQTRLLDWTDHAVFDRNGKVIEYQRTGRDITNAFDSIMQGLK